ncbi:ATP-binding protein [Candidatus Gottesmanbacteria bacterium]|nr:ATP-binding protein [Candidatus Gottesmanbacteria bacterium]
MTENNPTKIGIETAYIRRDLELTLEKYLPLPQILAIVGPRRSGKTTFLTYLSKKLPESIFLSFEDEDILNLFENDIKSFAKLYLEPNKNIILDELQYAKRGGKNLKYLFDSYPGKKIIISGSSSLDLTLRAARYLVGRILSFPLYPFSFEEFLRAKEPQLEELIGQKNPSPTLTRHIRTYLNEYLIYGGYPEVVLENNLEIKQTLLKNIYQLYFLKDVTTLAHLVDDWKLKTLVKILAANIGGILNYSLLCSQANIDFKTLKSYLNFLEKTFIIFLLFPFFTNKTKEITKNPKIYFYDLGLRNVLISSFEPVLLRNDLGFLRENFLAIRLKPTEAGLHFWRTKAKAEVDFVVEKENEVVPIEVKSQLQGAKISRSLQSFLFRYQPKNAFVANLEFFGQKKFVQTMVNFVPLYFSPYFF